MKMSCIPGFISTTHPRVAALALLFAAIPAVLCAAPTARFNYQAKLTEPDGAPLTGSHPVHISLFQGGDASTANSGANVYSESVSASLTEGVLNHTVGTGTPTSGTLTSDLFAYNGDMFLQVAVDTPGNVILPRHRLESVPFAIEASQPTSLFGQFGGSGADGTTTIIGLQSLTKSRYEFNDFTIPVGTTATAINTHTFIAVKGKCTIQGVLSAAGRGAQGGPAVIANDSAPSGLRGSDATDLRTGTGYVPMCISGAGGGGQTPDGATGGGAGGNGGATAVGGTTTPAFQRAIATMAQAGSGQTMTDDFPALLKYSGAGGGSGGAESDQPGYSVISGAGGAGGGVIYIECDELEFTGALDASGRDGGNGGGNARAGGGGGGGIVLVRVRKTVSNAGIVDVSGGAGGRGSFDIYGGAGAPGFWDIVELP